MNNITLRPLNPEDRPWVTRWVTERWGAPQVVSRGVVHQVDELPGFAATYTGLQPFICYEIHTGEAVGLVTYRVKGRQCEIVTIDSLAPNLGIGTKLIQAVKDCARQAGCLRVWLITTNDNTPALRFYQRRGFRLAALHRGAIQLSRSLKPEIPQSGLNGIPLRDEIELDFWLG